MRPPYKDFSASGVRKFCSALLQANMNVALKNVQMGHNSSFFSGANVKSALIRLVDKVLFLNFCTMLIKITYDVSGFKDCRVNPIGTGGGSK